MSVLAGRRGQLSAASRRHGQADPGQEGGLGVLAEMVPASAHDQVHSLAGERNRVLEVRPRLGDGLGEQRGRQEGAGELLRGIVPRLVLQIVSIQPPEDRPGLKLVPVPGLMGQILAQAHLAAARTLQQVHRPVLVPLRVAGAVNLSLRNSGRVRPRPPEAGQVAAAGAVHQPVETEHAASVLGNRGLAVDDADRDPVPRGGAVGQVSVRVVEAQPQPAAPAHQEVDEILAGRNEPGGLDALSGPSALNEAATVLTSAR